MKKWIIVAALATAILASCTKNEVRVDAPDQAISFTTAVGANSTKAMIDNTAYPTDETFGTFAFYLPTGQNWFTNNAAAELYIPHSEVEYVDDVDNVHRWTTDTKYYWPTAGSLTFFSYSPYDINASVTCSTETNGIVISNYDVDGNQDHDVMVADVCADQTTNGSNNGLTGVPTVFRHKLAQIVAFNFNTAEDYGAANDTHAAGDKEIIVTGIRINDLRTTGTYYSGRMVGAASLGNWQDWTGSKNYVWYAAEGADPGKEIVYNDSGYTTSVETDGTDAVANDYLLVLPQPFSDNDTQVITLNYTIRTYTSDATSTDDDVTVSIPLFDIHGEAGFQMNKKITYNFTIGLDQIWWAPSVADWENETHSITINQGKVTVNS